MRILYEDNHLLAVEKPPNVPVQADSSGDADLLTMAKAYLKQAHQKPGEAYLALVHRLDRPVGGVLLFCKTSKAAARVSQILRTGDIEKEYLAVVQGGLSGAADLTCYLVKDEKTNTSRVCAKETPGAKFAQLHYEALASRDGLTLVRVHLGTGRSHQIRVQMADHGHPLWGDARYGGGRPGQQIALWAHRLAFLHPVKKEPVEIVSDPPGAMPWSLFEDVN